MEGIESTGVGTEAPQEGQPQAQTPYSGPIDPNISMAHAQRELEAQAGDPGEELASFMEDAFGNPFGDETSGDLTQETAPANPANPSVQDTSEVASTIGVDPKAGLPQAAQPAAPVDPDREAYGKLAAFGKTPEIRANARKMLEEMDNAETASQTAAQQTNSLQAPTAPDWNAREEEIYQAVKQNLIDKYKKVRTITDDMGEDREEEVLRFNPDANPQDELVARQEARYNLLQEKQEFQNKLAEYNYKLQEEQNQRYAQEQQAASAQRFNARFGQYVEAVATTGLPINGPDGTPTGQTTADFFKGEDGQVNAAMKDIWDWTATQIRNDPKTHEELGQLISQNPNARWDEDTVSNYIVTKAWKRLAPLLTKQATIGNKHSHTEQGGTAAKPRIPSNLPGQASPHGTTFAPQGGNPVLAKPTSGVNQNRQGGWVDEIMGDDPFGFSGLKQ